MNRAIRVGIIDSGVNPDHPHVANIVGGIGIDRDGESPDFLDTLGHGTAIAAVIHEKAPHAHLFAIKVFQKTLTTNIDAILRAVQWCLDKPVDVINLSLGTLNPNHRASFESAVAKIVSKGKVLVSAFEVDGQPALPGRLPGVIAVSADARCSQDRHYLREMAGKRIFVTSPFPRPIPGVPPEQNLHGISFAVAHMAGVIAREWATEPDFVNWQQRLESLAECDAVSVTAGHH